MVVAAFTAGPALAVDPGPGGIRSDEFDSGFLDTSVWRFVDPVGDVRLSMNPGNAVIDVPSGSAHDLWTGSFGAPRLVQDIPDGDFVVETKLGGVLTSRYQMEGVIVQQDEDDLLRLEVHSDGSGTKLFAASFTGGSAEVEHYSSVVVASPVYLQVARAGDWWTLRYSSDGVSWIDGATFMHVMTVKSLGVFAGNAGDLPAFSLPIDYVRDVTPPTDTAPPAISGPTATAWELSARVDWATDEPATSSVAYGTTSAYGNSISKSDLATSHSIELQRLDCGTTYHFEVRSRDEAGNEAVSGDKTVTTAACPMAIRSDEFSGTALDRSVWTFLDPLGDSSLAYGSDQASISVPEGRAHDLWSGALDAPRLLQAAPNTDFEVEAKFDSAVTAGYQLQGIVVEQDPNNLLRLELHHDGSQTKLFIASVVAGTAQTEHYETVAGGAPAYLRLKRGGDVWSLQHSLDGEAWTTSRSFTRALAVTAIGPYAGNVGSSPPAFTSAVDYFRLIPPDTTPPAIASVTATASAIGAEITWTTDERADSRVRYGPTAAYELGVVGRAESVLSHGIALRSLTCGTTYHYRVESKDGEGNEAVSGDAVFTTAACPTAISSDEFSALDRTLWTVVDPLGDASIGVDLGRVRISLPAGSAHDLWTGANDAPRLLQAAPDGDFEVEAKFDSAVTAQYQFQGIVVEQDESNLLRFEVHHDGTDSRLFVASMVNGSASTIHSSRVAGGAPLWLRVVHSGDGWKVRWSGDGTTFKTPVAFSHALAVTAVGPFAGNSGKPVPAFTSEIDHFRLIPPDLTAPSVSAPAVTAGLTAATISWSTNEPATTELEFGPTTTYGRGVWKLSLSTSHSVDLTGLYCDTVYHFRIWAEDAAGNRTSAGDLTFATAACPPPSGPAIDVWYGDSQTFGTYGFPQRWLNVLGSASDPNGLLWIEYRLDGGEPVSLAYDSDVNVRLARHGDFNIELDRLALAPGRHEVTITASDRVGDISTRVVEVDVQESVSWPLPLVNDWSLGFGGAQPVDGHWAVTSGGVRTSAPGYDRTLAMGDETWTGVDVTVPVTIHALNPDSPHAGVGIATGWRGHEGTARPRLDWPLGGLCFYYRNAVDDPYQLWMVQFAWPHFVASDGRSNRLEPDTSYTFRMRAEPIDATSSRYSCKVWPSSELEPADWDVSEVLPTREGSVLLVADYADVTFGTVTIQPVG